MGARDAVLPVDKPVGPTSHDVVAAARRALGTRRVGHTGTLDPFASGLMLLCIGRATRISQYLTGLDKTYEAEARLGVETDTLDGEGTVVAESGAWADVTTRDIEAAMAVLRGEILQVPPQYSAKKVAGVAMHRRARAGEYVELGTRAVTVHELDVIDVHLPRLRFRVRCSSGTYVRALARDLGSGLGVGAHLTELRRTAVGEFSVRTALPVHRFDDADALRSAWLEPLTALAHLPRVEVDASGVAALGFGQGVEVEGGTDADEVAVAANGALVAVGSLTNGWLRPRKVFVG